LISSPTAIADQHLGLQKILDDGILIILPLET